MTKTNATAIDVGTDDYMGQRMQGVAMDVILPLFYGQNQMRFSGLSCYVNEVTHPNIEMHEVFKEPYHSEDATHVAWKFMTKTSFPTPSEQSPEVETN